MAFAGEWPDKKNDHIAGEALLGRRVFQTPILRWILPARLRSQSTDDLVFIGETSVQLKQWHPESASLIDVAAIENFRCRIKGAAVLGNGVKPEHNPPRDPSTSTGSTSNDSASNDAISNHSISNDSTSNASIPNGSTSNGSTSLEIEHHATPPQILVLLLSSHQLAFLTVAGNDNQYQRLNVKLQPLPALADMHAAESFLAVDPYARAIAVATSDKKLIIYDLSPTPSSQELKLRHLIKADQILHPKMTILKMDFVQPSNEDPERVVLVALGLEDGRLQISSYSWDFSKLSEDGDVKATKHRLGREHGFPLSLIPLKSELAAGYFILVEEETMFLFQILTDGVVHLTDYRALQDVYDNQMHSYSYSGVSSRMPLWNNWAHLQCYFDGKNEIVYLGREDGAISFVEVGLKKQGIPGALLRFKGSGAYGELPCNIDSAMIVLETLQRATEIGLQYFIQEGARPDFFQYYPCTFLVASANGDGGIYELEHSSDPKIVAKAIQREPRKFKVRRKLLNCAPFSAVTSIEASSSDPASKQVFSQSTPGYQAEKIHTIGRERLFVTSGNQPNGSITELRYGFEVQLMVSRTPQNIASSKQHGERLNLEHCNGVWPIEFPGQETLFVFSFAWYSVVAVYSRESSTISSLVAFTYEEPTLAASVIYFTDLAELESSKRAVQIQATRFMVCVTPKNIHLLKIDQPDNADTSSTVLSCVQTWTINKATSATILKHPWRVWTASSNSEPYMHNHLSTRRIKITQSAFELVQVGHGSDFDEEISCLNFVETQTPERVTKSKETEKEPEVLGWICVGTVSGAIHVAKVRPDDGSLQFLFKYQDSRRNSSSRESAVIESIDMLEITEKKQRYILCGTRSGRLLVLWSQRDLLGVETTAEIEIVKTFQTPAGDWPVRILRDPTCWSRAAIYCGSDVGMVSVEDGCLIPSFKSVYFSEDYSTTLTHGFIDAMAFIPDRHHLAGCLIAVSRGEFLAGVPSHAPKPTPLRRQVPGTPSKILYSKQWKTLVCASTVSHVSVGNKKRLHVPAIFCLNPNTEQDGSAMQEEIDRHDFGESAYYCGLGERVCDLIECFIQRGDKIYHFLIATLMFTTEGGREQGKILGFKDKQRLSLVFDTSEPAPVFAICQTNQGSLLYCCGHEVKMRTYDPGKKKWHKSVLKMMASPGVGISIREKIVIVTTQLHSAMVFLLDEEARSLQSVYNDTRPRSGICCLDLPEHKLILMASKHNNIIGISGVLGNNDTDEMLETERKAWVEASLPSSISGLAQANVRVPWKRYHVPGIGKRDIFGVAIDGAVFSFSVITKEAWEFLRFIQLMWRRNEWDATTQSFEGPGYGLKEFYIDSESFVGLLKLANPAAELERMLNARPRKNRSALTGAARDYSSAAERRARFRVLLKKLIHDWSPTVSVWRSMMAGGQSEAEIAVQYLRSVLEVPL